MSFHFFQDRLLNNPWAEPPSANDWLVQPTYPRHDPVPYCLAPLWDKYCARADRHPSKINKSGAKEQKPRIPKELRLRLKHARAARGMLQGLEEDVRHFVQRWNEMQLALQREELRDPSGWEEVQVSSDSDETSEDEIVFVGRNRQDRKQRSQLGLKGTSERYDEKMVFESVVDDRAAAFG